MSERPPKNRKFSIGVLASFATILSALATPLLVNDPRDKIVVLLLTTLPILGAGATAILWDRIQEAVENARSRLGGPDLKKTNVFVRPIVLVGTGIYRWFWRRLGGPSGWAIFFGLLGGLLIWALHARLIYLEDVPAYIWVISPLGFVAFVGLTTVVTWIFFVFFSRLLIFRRRQHPKNQVRRLLMDKIWEYADAYEDALTSRREITINDPGPISVVSATGADLLRPVNGFRNAFEAAWDQNENKRFRLLLADPIHNAVIARNRRLNGRYLQYYVIPYLRMHLLWWNEKRSGKEQTRVDLYRLPGRVDYRAVLGRDTMVLQKYSTFQHGYKDRFVVLRRVGFADEIEAEISQLLPCGALADAPPANGNAAGASRCALRESTLFDVESKSFAGSKDSIFGRLARSIESQFPKKKESFLDGWDPQRLRVLALKCGIGKRRCEEIRSDRRQLAKEICESVGLGKEFREATA